jgi:predicted ATPase/DNA-binding CsgD family transcriptional regulator
VSRPEREQAGRRAGNIWTPPTSLVGREHDTAEVTRLLTEYRLVTVTGPGGVGKTRVATEAARRLEDQFPDGVWLLDLGAVTDGAQVAAEAAAALGVQEDPGRPAVDGLAEVLAPRRLLLVLDNCEHVLPAVAELTAALLGRADEVRMLATSRERIGMAGETQYRLAPLSLPDPAEPGAVIEFPAAALFVERARQADPRFTVDAESASLVARVVTRLDGMPLAIELAAARVEALGLAGLADRIDDALRLLTGKDLLAADRHRSLAAVAEWSYQLLTEPERRVFRRLSVFPGPFTLEAAEAVAGREAGPIVLRLVDCSLLVPPRPRADGRTRYAMLQTLRAYGLAELDETGDGHEALKALTAFAWLVAGQAALGMQASDGSEIDALNWLDAEAATLSRGLGWALDHDADSALRLATALVPWLRQRGRLVEARTRLRAAAARSALDDETWARAQLWLGYLASDSADAGDGADHHTAVIDAYQHLEPSPVLVEALASGRAMARLNQHDLSGAADDAGRALALARELGDPLSELLALTGLSATAYYQGAVAEALAWTRQAEELLAAAIPGDAARWCRYVLALVLTGIGETDSARRVCAAGLTLSRQVDDLVNQLALLAIMADLERLAGNLAVAAQCLEEQIVLASRIGHDLTLANGVESCGYLCAATGQWADAVTLWSAVSADRRRRGRRSEPENEVQHADYMRRVEQALDPGQLREAHDRGALMTISAAAELAIMVAGAAHEREAAEPAPGKLLSPRERELVTLVAQGHTNAEIAERLYISVRTVTSHLDRIRDKTGYRRRADLTRLAIEESLI